MMVMRKRSRGNKGELSQSLLVLIDYKCNTRTPLEPFPSRSLSRILAILLLLLLLLLLFLFLLVIALALLLISLALLEARARDEPHDVPQEQVLVLAPKHSLESRVGWSGVEWSGVEWSGVEWSGVLVSWVR